jgi:hypothetical protein
VIAKRGRLRGGQTQAAQLQKGSTRAAGGPDGETKPGKRWKSKVASSL